MASQVVLSVALISLIVRTNTGHRNSEIYQAIQTGVLHPRYHLQRNKSIFFDYQIKKIKNKKKTQEKLKKFKQLIRHLY